MAEDSSFSLAQDAVDLFLIMRHPPWGFKSEREVLGDINHPGKNTDPPLRRLNRRSGRSGRIGRSGRSGRNQRRRVPADPATRPRGRCPAAGSSTASRGAPRPWVHRYEGGKVAGGESRTRQVPLLPPAAARPAMTAFARPAPGIRAAVELVLASLVDPALAGPVLEPTRQWLRDHVTSGPDPVRAAQGTAILTWALGLAVFSTRPWTATMDLDPALAHAHWALAHPTTPVALPDAVAGHLYDSPFNTDDPRIDLALDNALASIGTIGYHRTRLVDIATKTGVSEGFILIRFTTKLGLMRAIIDAGYAEGYQAFTDYQERIAAEHGPGIAEATAWRQYLDPNISDRQTLGMETDRLSLFNPTMRDTTFPQDLAVLDQQLATTPDTDPNTATGRIHLDFASGHGLPITALLLPEAWTLPFNTITEPYLQQLSVADTPTP